MIHINNSGLMTVVLWSAVRVICVACFVALVLAAFRVKTTSLRLFAWKSVLIVALAMPILGLFLPPTLIPLPSWLQTGSSAQAELPLETSVTAEHTVAQRAAIPLPRKVATTDESKTAAPVAVQSAVTRFSIPIDWRKAATATYVVVALFLVCRLIIGWFFSRKLVRASQAVNDPRIRGIINAHGSALDATLTVAESGLISVPVTVGALRSTVLLPAQWREWDDTRLEAVIAHELSHVTRHDALMQHASLLHRAIFWFSPFAWWLDRHLAALAEQASDEAALATGADRNDYARILLGFFEALQTAHGRVWWQGVSMANGGNAEKRLERILSWKGAVPMGVRKSLVLAIVILAVPVVYLAASAHPTAAQGDPANIVRAQTAAPTAPSSLPGTSAVPAVAPVPGVPAPGSVGAPAAPTAAIAPIPPMAEYRGSLGQTSGTSSGPGYSYAYGYDDEDRFVIVSGKSNAYTMSGSTQDIHHVERLKKQIGGDFIWFQRDEKSYIIRDQATIDRAKAFWAPEEELGRKQEELGKQQEALGKQQEELGKKQEQVRVSVPPDLTAKLDALKAKLQKLGPTATMDQIGDLQSEIGDLQGQIGEIQGRAGEQQGKLGEEQGKLGEQQGKLGEEQGKLGEEQGRLAEEAVKKTRALFDECIKNGKAQPEQESSGGASL